MTTRTLNGPGGLRVELDSSEIYPDDPGQGTPAMVYLPGSSSTFWRAVDCGSLYDSQGRDVELTGTQQMWLQDQEDIVAEFTEEHSN